MKLKRIKNGRAGYVSITELVALVIILVCFGLIAGIAYHHERVVMREGFQAWVKQTDNPKNLTYDEWRALIRSGKQHSQVILIPVPQ